MHAAVLPVRKKPENKKKERKEERKKKSPPHPFTYFSFPLHTHGSLFSYTFEFLVIAFS
jgi:hypothetical protein